MVMTTSFAIPGSLTGATLALVYREAFKRLGLNVAFVVVPSVRSDMMATRGEVDGLMHRVKEFGDARPTLRMVPTSHFADNFVAYAVKPIELKHGWGSLNNTALYVNYRLGTVKSERELTGRVPAAQLGTVTTIEGGLRKLLAGRSDVFIEVESAADSVLLKPEFKAAPIHKAALLESADGYAFLHAKNEALVEPLAHVLAAMHKDGTIKKLRKQAALDEAL